MQPHLQQADSGLAGEVDNIIRRRHVGREARIKALGWLVVLGLALICVDRGVVFVADAYDVAMDSSTEHTVGGGLDQGPHRPAETRNPSLREHLSLDRRTVVFFLCLSLFIGCSLLRRDWARDMERAFLSPASRCTFALAAVWVFLAGPLGPLIGSYMLYLLLSPKGSMVFSERYAEAITRTPGIEPTRSPLVLVLSGVLVIGLLHVAAWLLVF